VQPKLVTLSALEWIAGLARRLGLGSLVDRLAPIVARPFEHFELDVDGVRLAGTELAHLHYVRELKEHGRERTFIALLAAAVPAGGLVLEGGAYLGFVTVHAARAAGPDGRVIAFEPNTAVHALLRRNLEANGVASTVEVVPKALGVEPGTAQFFLSADTSNLFGPHLPEATVVEIEVVRADDEVTGRIDVVKLDLEGGEPAALRGMAGLLSANRPPPAVFVECHPELLERAGSSAAELFAILGAHGYTVEWIDEAAGRTAPLTEPWSDAYVNLCCRRVA
jgi:FkbM family methyltransferase